MSHQGPGRRAEKDLCRTREFEGQTALFKLVLGCRDLGATHGAGIRMDSMECCNQPCTEREHGRQPDAWRRRASDDFCYASSRYACFRAGRPGSLSVPLRLRQGRAEDFRRDQRISRELDGLHDWSLFELATFQKSWRQADHLLLSERRYFLGSLHRALVSIDEPGNGRESV